MMQLTYRGICYQRIGQNSVPIGKVSGIYRGVPWRRCLFQATSPQAIAQLKYRGVSYSTIIMGGSLPSASARVPIGTP